MDDDELDRLLRALGDANRRRLLDRLRDAPGLTLSALGEGFDLSRQAVSKHLALARQGRCAQAEVFSLGVERRPRNEEAGPRAGLHSAPRG